MSSRIVYPVLNIYIGTSPIKVGRYVTRELRRLPETDQRKVASLFIDTMPIQEERANGQRAFGSDTLQIVIPRYQVDGQWNPKTIRNLYVGVPGAVHKPGISAAGAGGIRNNGHVAFCHWASSIQQSIREKLALIKSPPPVEQDQRAAASIRVNIIAFLGGGTGSGILPSLAVLTRYELTRTNLVPQTAIYAVLPEQPRGATEDMRRRQRSNAYSTLLELTALMRLKNEDAKLQFHLGALNLDLTAMHLVDVVYVYGHGQISRHDDIYYHIGMDLFTRMQDGHGAGFERLRQLPDLSGLQEGDLRGMPTFIATSGVTEVLFPRLDLLHAFARRAARTVLASQTSELSAVDAAEVERMSGKLGQDLIDQLNLDLGGAAREHVHESLGIDIYEAGDSWYEQVELRQHAYAKDLRLHRSTRLEALKQEFADRIQNLVMNSREAMFARYVRTYSGMLEIVRAARANDPDAAPVDRREEYEQGLFAARFFRGRRAGEFTDYANERLDEALQISATDNRRLALDALIGWLKDEVELRQQQLTNFRRMFAGGGDDAMDRQLIDDAAVPRAHVYIRPALNTPQLVHALWNHLLTQSGLGRDGVLDIVRTLDEVQEYRARHPDGHTDLTPQMVEGFFAQRFGAVLQVRNQTTGETRPISVYELVLQFGGEALLRQQLRWGMEWARGHLNYNPYQEEQTNGRIARHLDLAVMHDPDKDGPFLEKVMREESTRSDVQNGLRLLVSLDPDRITFLYTEYAIPVRAIDGMHELADSYLQAYNESQAKWRKNGIMPPHASSLLQAEVARSAEGGRPLVHNFADEPTIDLDLLYGNLHFPPSSADDGSDGHGGAQP